MLRTALKPRWLGLLVFVILVVASFTWLGMWQLDVARDRQNEERLQQIAVLPAEDIGQVLPPHTPLTQSLVGRRVTATGTYDASHQEIVVPRVLDGRVGAWVLTPLNVDGSYLPVVRGWVADPAEVQPPPAGEITVVGALAPPESAPDEAVALPEGQVATIDVATMVNEWDAGVFSAFAYMESEQLASGEVVAWTPTLVPSPGFGPGGIQWRNLAYALQWWLFAAFAVYMWFRMVREDAQATQAAALTGASGAPPAPGADADATGSSVSAGSTFEATDPEPTDATRATLAAQGPERTDVRAFDATGKTFDAAGLDELGVTDTTDSTDTAAGGVRS